MLYSKALKSPHRIRRRRHFDPSSLLQSFDRLKALQLRGRKFSVPARLLRLPLKGGVIEPTNGFARSLHSIRLLLNVAKAQQRRSAEYLVL